MAAVTTHTIEDGQGNVIEYWEMDAKGDLTATIDGVVHKLDASAETAATADKIVKEKATAQGDYDVLISIGLSEDLARTLSRFAG